MNFYKLPTLLFVTTLILGCAATPELDNKTAAVTTENVVVTKEVQALARTDISNEELGEKLVCRSEQKLGTKFKTRVCRTKKQVEEERQVARDEIDKMRRGAPITSN